MGPATPLATLLSAAAGNPTELLCLALSQETPGMHNSNPFAPLPCEETPPATADSLFAQPSSWDPHTYRVEGNLLVCGPVCRLPPICVYTGNKDNLQAMETRRSGFRVHWHQSRSISLREQSRRALMILVAVNVLYVILQPAMPGTILPGPTGSQLGLAISIMPSVLAAALIILLRCPPELWLCARRHVPPDTFYIEGFSEQYLQSLPDRSPAAPDQKQ